MQVLLQFKGSSKLGSCLQITEQTLKWNFPHLFSHYFPNQHVGWTGCTMLEKIKITLYFWKKYKNKLNIRWHSHWCFHNWALSPFMEEAFPSHNGVFFFCPFCQQNGPSIPKGNKQWQKHQLGQFQNSVSNQWTCEIFRNSKIKVSKLSQNAPQKSQQ